jgi:hypothetical protein
MIQKDEPVRDAQEQIEPDIAPVGGENSFDVHGTVSQGGFKKGVARIKAIAGNRRADAMAIPIDFT